jgi:hypothetical protein
MVCCQSCSDSCLWNYGRKTSDALLRRHSQVLPLQCFPARWYNAVMSEAMKFAIAIAVYVAVSLGFATVIRMAGGNRRLGPLQMTLAQAFILFTVFGILGGVFCLILF